MGPKEYLIMLGAVTVLGATGCRKRETQKPAKVDEPLESTISENKDVNETFDPNYLLHNHKKILEEFVNGVVLDKLSGMTHSDINTKKGVWVNGLIDDYFVVDINSVSNDAKKDIVAFEKLVKDARIYVAEKRAEVFAKDIVELINYIETEKPFEGMTTKDVLGGIIELEERLLLLPFDLSVHFIDSYIQMLQKGAQRIGDYISKKDSDALTQFVTEDLKSERKKWIDLAKKLIKVQIEIQRKEMSIDPYVLVSGYVHSNVSGDISKERKIELIDAIYKRIELDKPMYRELPPPPLSPFGLNHRRNPADKDGLLNGEFASYYTQFSNKDRGGITGLKPQLTPLYKTPHRVQHRG